MPDVEEEGAANQPTMSAPQEIETVIAVRNVEAEAAPHRVLRKEYLVQWRGQDASSNSWVSRTRLGKAQEQALFLYESGYLDEDEPVRKAR